MDESLVAPAVPIRDERKVITVLFADLVGSTALAESVGAEEARLVVGEAVARIVRVIQRYGGTVKDLAGDGVLALFGAPVAHEDDAERALRTGLEITAEMRAYAAEVEAGWGIAGFGVRVGVNTGEVVLGELGAGDRVEYAAFGDTVNTCARLQSLAVPGEVLATAATRQAAEGLFEFGEPQSHAVRGRDEPVEASGVLAVLAAGSRHPHTTTAIVGRELELEQTRGAVEGVISGSGGIVALIGEPGVGKSRVAAELRQMFADAGAERHGLWLEGRCVSYGEAMPYWLFRDLLRGWLGVGLNEPDLRVRVALRRALADAVGDRSEQFYPYLGALLGLALEPGAQARVAELSPEALQYRTFEVVDELVCSLASDGPVTLLLEDLHWADATSLALVERLLGVTDHAAVLMVVTARPDRDAGWWQALETAAREYPHRLRQLQLRPLDGASSDALFAALAEAESFTPQMRARVLESGEGNPFYLEEILCAMADAGALEEHDGRWRMVREAELDLPPTVEQVILARIDRLDPESREVLLAASVIGRRFGLPLLDGVIANHAIDPATALRELQRLDLVREERRWPEPEYRFKHALIQEGAYRTLVAERRQAMHAAAAQWLEHHHADALDEYYALLAHHWRAAADDERAARYLALAGDRARRAWALDEAIGHYRELVALQRRRGENAAAAEVLFKLAHSLHTSMRFGEANTVYQQAFELWTPAAAGTPATKTLRIQTTYVPRVCDPTRAGWWADIRACMQLFDRLVEAGPERTMLPSLAERWDISPDGLRYRFYLREGLRWSDGTPLTAADLEYAIVRTLDPQKPGASVAVYFVLEGAREYYHGLHADPARIGVRALDERTVEFRLAAPAPYFMSVVNRADCAPLPRHAIEAHGDGWAEPGVQVVSGAFRQTERTPERFVLERRPESARHAGNVHTVDIRRAHLREALASFAAGDTDLIPLVYSPRVADHLPPDAPAATPGPAAWSAYLGFRHADPLTGDRDLRRALALAVDREALARVLPSHLPVASGGIVPPALQGHTADIALGFNPEAAAACLGSSSTLAGTELTVAAQDVWADVLEVLAGCWREHLGITISTRFWRAEDVAALPRPWELGQVYIGGWLPGYPDPEYCLRLLLQSDALTNEGGFNDPELDALIDRARTQETGAARLELFHQVDRTAVVDRVALIPLCYGRNVAFLRDGIDGWWEFGKSSSPFAALTLS